MALIKNIVGHEVNTSDSTRLDTYSLALLQAISRQGQVSVDAYHRWRAITDINIADGRVFSILPLLTDLLSAEGLHDPDLPRMRGVSRQIWAGNTLKMRLLFKALDSLKQAAIKPVLLKGAALFARDPNLIGKRAVGDYDLLIPPKDLASATDLLRSSGFTPTSLAWSQFDLTLFQSVAAGMPITHPDHDGEIDIHWRPLWNNHSSALLCDTIARAKNHTLHGRQVRVVSPTDQLFLAMARCEPWDQKECFARLVEAYLLLGPSKVTIEWDLLAAQATRFGLTRQAVWFFENLEVGTGIPVSTILAESLASQPSELEHSEWEVRRVGPHHRRETLKRVIQVAEQQFSRAASQTLQPLSEHEAILRDRSDAATHMPQIWRLALERIDTAEADKIGFLEGWSYPELVGRWSEGKWAILSLPCANLRNGHAKVRLSGSLFNGKIGMRRFYAYAGNRIVSRTLTGSKTVIDVSVPCQAVPRLGDLAIILLFMPDAQVPAYIAAGEDPRMIGFFVPTSWFAIGGRQTFNARALQLARRFYQSLPLSPKLRSLIGPAAIAVAQKIFTSSTRLPLIDEVRPGDIVVSGFFSDATGIGKAGRLTRDAMRNWPVAITTHDLRLDASGKSVTTGANGIWICHCNPPQALAFMMESSNRFWMNRYRIGIWAYELPRLPRSWLPSLHHFHEIWAPSEFVASAIRAEKVRGLTVRVVPHPVLLPNAIAAEREPPSGKPFRFLVMFDLRSSLARKNPEGAIEAFQKAFTPQANARLLLKAHGVEGRNAELEVLRKRINNWPNIVLMVQSLNDQETVDLVRSCDCFVSLHRSEGFGLVVAEAMSVGTPVIATNWSAPAEFMNGAAIPIGYSLVPATDSSGRYNDASQLWAEPDLDEAAKAMLDVIANPITWRTMSAAGPNLVKSHFGTWLSSQTYGRFINLTS